MIRIAIDAMGGDNAPDAILKGAVEALKENTDVQIILFGPEQTLREKLQAMKADFSRLEIVDAQDVITLHEAPVLAVRRKKESSLVKALYYVRDRHADALISAGSSGAILAGGQLIIKRLPGVERPPLGAIIPTEKGVSLLVDCGANVDAKPEWLRQFALMGTIYMREMLGIKNPSVGLVNIGAEEEKGNALVKESMTLLKDTADIRFKGSVEARDIPFGEADIIIADAFVGNVVLKMYEGTSRLLMKKIKAAMKSSPLSMLGALLVLPGLKKTLKTFDAKKYGGAPLLGLNGLVVKVHGNTDGREITHAVRQSADFVKADVVHKIAAEIGESFQAAEAVPEMK